MGIGKGIEAYREMDIETASPIEVVIMLCDALIRELKQVAAAIRIADIEARVKQSNHAFSVLQELDRMLNFETGGETARDLARVYSHVRAKLIEAQIKLNPAIIERQIDFMQQICGAWRKALAGGQSTMASAESIPSFDALPYSYIGSANEAANSSSWSA